MTNLPSSIPDVDERDYDIVDLQQLTNSGAEITAVATLVALDGSLEYVNCTHRRSSSVCKVYPDSLTPASVILWLEKFGMMDLTEDLSEAMAEQRDWLKGLDVMTGGFRAFAFARGRS